MCVCVCIYICNILIIQRFFNYHLMFSQPADMKFTLDSLMIMKIKGSVNEIFRTYTKTHVSQNVFARVVINIRIYVSASAFNACVMDLL